MVQTSRNSMNIPKSDCRTGKPKKRTLPHNMKTAESETQHCLSMKMALSRRTPPRFRLAVSHKA